jgi:two-component system OmpR family sensor kinase
MLAATAVVHHASELAVVSGPAGPLLSLALDALPAAGLVYASFWLQRAGYSRDHEWRVLVCCCLGAVTFTTVTGASLAVRAYEGRTLAEPSFSLLLSASIGGTAGFVAGYFYVRALADADRARRANDALSFVNDVLRHDLRNTLNVVSGNASLVAERTDDDELASRATAIQNQTGEALHRIESAGEMVATLTEDADLHTVDLADVAVDCADRVAGTHDVTVETDLPDSAPVVADDGVGSVVHNLVENAAEHNDADDPRVVVAVQRDGDRTRLEVTDNGPGFDDPAVHDGIAAVDDAGGLRLAGTLVDHYGGDAWAKDTDSPGATVVVDLPRAT